MSLSKKISEEMAALSYRILQRAGHVDDEKLKKMLKAYYELKALLEKASELETP